MNVGILTFHASHNYGSMLQAYAMQTILANNGIDSVIINYRSDVQKSLIPPPLDWKHPRSSLRKLISDPFRTISLIRKYKRFEHFIHKDLNVTDELSTPEAVAQHISINHYDAIITGSDQIWNPGCWDFSTVYLCDFAFDGKRIAYAPSMGSYPEGIPKDELDLIIGLAAQYSALSTREKRGSDFLSHRLDQKVEVVIDPTLLLKAEDYDSITSEKLIDRPYILYYTPREEKGTFYSALALSDKLGLDIVVTQDFEDYDGHDNVIHLLDCGPNEFLSLIKNASYCIGNSFHLLAFSLIFHKEFILLSHEQDSRMMNLLEPIELMSRLQSPTNNIQLQNKIRYSKINEIMDSMAHNSICFLTNAINS